jgi:hypothetical protein
MATKKHSPARCTASRLGTKARAGPALKTVPNEIAARYRTVQERKVRDALAPFGSVEAYSLQRMVVLHRAPDLATAKVRAALDDLQRVGLVEFVAPVPLDPDSNARQVLTDESVLRVKPGRTQRTRAALKAEHGIRRRPQPPMKALRLPWSYTRPWARLIRQGAEGIQCSVRATGER